MTRQDYMTQDEYDDAVEYLMGGDDSRGVPDEAIEADEDGGRYWLANTYYPRLESALAAAGLRRSQFSSDARAIVYLLEKTGVHPIYPERPAPQRTGIIIGTPECDAFCEKWWGPDR